MKWLPSMQSWSNAGVCCALVFASASLPATTPGDFLFKAAPPVDGGSLPYRLYIAQGYAAPESAARQYPLILFLHGIGERGTDNLAPLNAAGGTANGAIYLVSDANQAYEPAFLMVPQVPTSMGGWVGAGFEYAENGTMAALRDVMANYRIDPDRIIVTGLSMGGGGAWRFLAKYPGLFAAGAPLSMVGPGTEQIAMAANLPIWACDAADQPSGTNSTVSVLRNVGASVIFTNYANGLHSATTWGAFYGTPEVYRWMMAQRRGQPMAGPPFISRTLPTAALGVSLSAGSVVLAGTAGDAAANISKVALSNNVTSYGNAAGTTSWTSGSIALAPGVNVVQAIASGTSYQPARGGDTTFNSTLIVNDNLAPTISFNGLSGPTYDAPLPVAMVRGYASDDQYVTEVRWLTDRGETGLANVNTDNTSVTHRVAWFASGIPLQSGSNFVTFTARDRSGHSASIPLTINYDDAGGGYFFKQDFNSSSVLSDYAQAVDPAFSQFDGLSADPGGGTWSITPRNSLQIVRLAGTGANANFYRTTPLLGAPSSVRVSFNLTLPGTPNTNSILSWLTLGQIWRNPTGGSRSVPTHNELEIRSNGLNKFVFRTNGIATPIYAANGASYSVDWFVNASTSSLNYIGLDGSAQSVDSNCSTLWVGGQRVLNNIARASYFTSMEVDQFRFHLNTLDAMTLELDDLAVRSFPVTPPDPYASWKYNYFGTSANDPAIAGDQVDFDKDGLSNLLEYALGSNPIVPDQASQPLVSANNGFLQLSFKRLQPADVTYIVEASADLKTWTAIATLARGASSWVGAASVTESGGGSLRTVSVVDTANQSMAGARFLRLSVSRP